MGSLSSVYIKTETLKTLFETLNKKGEKGIELTVSIGDDSNEYGQNLSAYVSQTKEQRDQKVKRYFVGNGKVFWTDGKIAIGAKKEEVHNAVPVNEDETDDLPF